HQLHAGAAIAKAIAPNVYLLTFFLFFHAGHNPIDFIVLHDDVVGVVEVDARGVGGELLVAYGEDLVVAHRHPRGALDSNAVGIAAAGATHAVDLHVLNHHAAHPAVAGAEHAHAQRRRALNMKTVDDNIIPRKTADGRIVALTVQPR